MIIATLLVAVSLAAAPSTTAVKSPANFFPPAQTNSLPNGVIVTWQIANDAPIASAQVFVPVGLAQQSVDKAGIAAVTAAEILRTPVDDGRSVSEAAQLVGGTAAYTVDPDTTRFEIESNAADLPRLLGDLARAMANPDASRFNAAREEVASAARDADKNPALVAYAMVRQVRYQGNGFAYPQGGRAATLARLTAADIARFAATYEHGPGTVIAITGALTQTDADVASKPFARWSSSPAPAATAANAAEHRQHEVVAHRDVPSPWVAVGYPAPSQFSRDFPTMLVIQALLGRGGDVHALSFGSAPSPAADEYVGAFYQYEAQPGAFLIFLNGASADVDATLHQMEQGIARLRASPLPSDLVTRARQVALGDYYLSVTSLSDAAWLLGRSASSPDGMGFENALAARIAAVTPQDVQRIAKQYLANETVAVVLPLSAGR